MKTIILLTVSNIFMNLAWYGHLKFKDRPLIVFTLAAFVLFRSPVRWNYLVSYVLITGAAYFAFEF